MAVSRTNSRVMKMPNPVGQTSRPDGFHGWVTVLVHQHRARLARVVRREGVRADDAFDCVQEAFLSFLSLPQARLLVDLPDDSARMLIILARNIARNRRRRHDYAQPHIVDDSTIQGLASDATSADDVVAAAEQHAMIIGCMATLNEVQRAVVRLRLVDEVPGKNVARQLGTTPAHVAVLLFRAKQYLRRCVEGAEAAPSPVLARARSRPQLRDRPGL
jgi:RNA polymerase sigma-70 factor, ECF subfamily